MIKYLMMKHVYRYNLCQILVFEVFIACDPGEILPVHLFGAIFGWCIQAVALSSMEKKSKVVTKSGITKRADDLLPPVVMLVGLPFLNSIISESDHEMSRAMINTVFASMTSITTAMSISMIVVNVTNDAKKRSESLGHGIMGGAVAVGCVGTLMLGPFGSMLVGAITGVITFISHHFLEPTLNRRLSLPSNGLGIFSFHGVAGLIGGLCSIVMATISEENDENALLNYNLELYQIYPGRIPVSIAESQCRRCATKDVIIRLA